MVNLKTNSSLKLSFKSLVTHIRNKSVSVPTFTETLKHSQLKFLTPKKLNVIKNYGASVSILKTAAKYRQLKTQTKRRLLTIRRVSFNRRQTKRSRLATLRLAVPTQTLLISSTPGLSTVGLPAIKAYVRNSIPTGIQFKQNWLNPVLKYVASGHSQAAKLYAGRQKTYKKVKRLLRRMGSTKVRRRFRPIKRKVVRKSQRKLNQTRARAIRYRKPVRLVKNKKITPLKRAKRKKNQYKWAAFKLNFARKYVAAQLVKLQVNSITKATTLMAKLSLNKKRSRQMRRLLRRKLQRPRPLKMKRGQTKKIRYKKKSKRFARIMGFKRRKAIKLKRPFPFSGRLSPYSRVQPFWLLKNLKQKRMRKFLKAQKYRSSRFPVRTRVSALLQAAWGHLNILPAVHYLPAEGWFISETKYELAPRALNPTYEIGHIGQPTGLLSTFQKFQKLAKMVLALTRPIPKTTGFQRWKNRRYGPSKGGRTAKAGSKEAALQANLNVRRTALKALNLKKAQHKAVRAKQRLKTRQRGFKHKRYTALIFQEPSHLFKPKVLALLRQRKLRRRALGLRGMYTRSINRLYIPRIHARLPFNPKWRKRQKKPNIRKKTIIASKRMCAVTEKSQRTQLKTRTFMLGKQPMLTLRRWYLQTLTAAGSRSRGRRKISRAKKRVTILNKAKMSYYRLIYKW